MHRYAALPLIIALASCGSSEPPSDPLESREPPKPRAQAAPPTNRQSTPQFTFSIIGSSDGMFADVTQIEVRQRGKNSPIQILDGFEARPPLVDGSAALEKIDMNFDGYADLRLIEFIAAGGNRAYLNWIYEPNTKRFRRAPILDAIPSASFEPKSREIHSSWRDGASRYGSDTYIWRDGEPTIVSRESRKYFRPGMYELTEEQFDGEQWQLIEKKTVAE